LFAVVKPFISLGQTASNVTVPNSATLDQQNPQQQKTNWLIGLATTQV